jgi:putative sigma-54 modulation protein
MSDVSVRCSVSFKHLDATESLKSYITEKLEVNLKKFVHHDVDVHAILAVEKNRQIAEAKFHVDGADFFSKEERDDLYVAIDAVVANLVQQLRKHRERLKSHH